VSLSWDAAREAAAALGRSRLPRTITVGIARAGGAVLAVEVRALAALPSDDVSAMDGWAVAGEGPWTVVGDASGGSRRSRLAAGHAVGVVTGAPVPPGTAAVVRSEDGEVLAGTLRAPATEAGRHVRRAGEEVRAGEELLPVGTRLGPAQLGMVAGAGVDSVTVVVPPRVRLVVTGSELLHHGVPTRGRVRDSLGPALPGWLSAMGAEVSGGEVVPDDPDLLLDAVAGPHAREVDVVVVTGGTAAGPSDHLRPVLRRARAKLLVDGVDVRPGSPSLLATVPGGPVVVGLPGNPLAAVAGLVTLAAPLLAAWTGERVGEPVPVAVLGLPPAGHPAATRLVPARYDVGAGAARVTERVGPAMLRGLADADGWVVVAPDGSTRWLALP
jgi:molybdopterin molybdotransferase